MSTKYLARMHAYQRRETLGRSERLADLRRTARRGGRGIYEIRDDRGFLVERWRVVNAYEMLQLFPAPEPFPPAIAALIRTGRKAA